MPYQVQVFTRSVDRVRNTKQQIALVFNENGEVIDRGPVDEIFTRYSDAELRDLEIFTSSVNLKALLDGTQPIFGNPLQIAEEQEQQAKERKPSRKRGNQSDK